MVRVALGWIGWGLVAAVTAGCGAHGGDAVQEGHLVLTLMGTPDSQPGSVALDGGSYEFRWSSDQPVAGSSVPVTLFTGNGVADAKVAMVVSCSVGADARHGSATAIIPKGTYRFSTITDGTWRLLVYARSRP